MLKGLPALGLALIPGIVAAQSVDTSSIAHYIPAAGSVAGAMLRARGVLVDRLRSGDLDGIGALLLYMASHPEWSGWISPRELLLARVAIGDAHLPRDPALPDLLDQAAHLREKPDARRGDEVLPTAIARVRNGGEEIAARLDRAGMSQEDRRFFLLLMNHLITNGYRARADLNRLVDRFAADYPASTLLPMARTYLRQEYREEDFGLGFSAGYLLGRFIGELSDRFAFLHGPFLSGELYIDRVTLSGTLAFGVARISEGFQAGDDRWVSGGAPAVLGSLLGGYEFRFGLLAVTPMAGLAMQSFRAPTDPQSAAPPPGTGNQLGGEIGALLGYRIPFDIGTHIDLRARVGLSTASLSSYDAGFGGAFYYASIGFALVHRPYRSIW